MKLFYSILLYFLVIIISKPAAAQCWQSLDAGIDFFSLGIKQDSTLWAWGKNDNGQLGDGTNTTKLAPVKIGLDHNWESISAGSAYCLALKNDGTLWAWGWNSTGQLGDGTNINKNVPIQIGVATDWESVTAGFGHSLAIKQDGTLWAWGANYNGQHGDGTFTNKNVPTQIGTDTNWQSVSAGARHTIAIRNDGTLWAWGANMWGQLGNGTNLPSNIPVQVGTDTNWLIVRASIDISDEGYSCAIKQDGTAWAWGINGYGQLGDGTYIAKNIPTQIGIDNDWQSISAGETHNLGIKQNGTLWAWGFNGWGQLGDGTDIKKNTPVQIGIDTTWRNAEAGGLHTLAIQTDNSLWAWGYNAYGQLGDGTNTPENIPTYISNANIGSCTPCQPNFTANWSPFTDSLVESQTWIITSGTVLIPSGSKVNFDADTSSYVYINPGFKAEYGSVFIAQAYNGCVAGAPQLPQERVTSMDLFSSGEIVLYPNPTTGMVHLKHDEKLAFIQIFDMVGKLLIEAKCDGAVETNIDLSNLPNGIYHIKAKGYKSTKVIKSD